LNYVSAKQSINKSELLEKWGEPTKIEVVDDITENWVYEFDDKIEKELLVMIGVIPLTIDLPPEARKITFTIKKGQVVKAKTKIEKQPEKFVDLCQLNILELKSVARNKAKLWIVTDSYPSLHSC
jgi:hypothetical protein